MKHKLQNIRIKVESDNKDEIKKQIAQYLGIIQSNVKSYDIHKKSLDARKKDQFYFNYSLIVDLDKPVNGCTEYKDSNYELRSNKQIDERPVIIGFGPAGIFAALTFIELGIKPVIFERGKSIDERNKDITEFISSRKLNEESNIQFGEGGAGAYSDAKLGTRIKDNIYVEKFLRILVKFGAPEEIIYQNKPHLGTDVIRKVVKNIREFLLKSAVEINFNSKLTKLILKKNEITGVEINNKDNHYSKYILLAIGHSARDTFRVLLDQGVNMESKPFAIGTRIEHPRELIDLIQYGEKYAGNEKLGAADYAFTSNNKKTGRGTFSFCMCPGGEIVAASSENECSVVNGMSLSKRNSPFSNSALVVPVKPKDLGSDHPLAGQEFQKNIEQKAFDIAGGNYETPAQNLLDFLNDKKSGSLLQNSHKIGTVSSELNGVLPGFVADEIKYAFGYWEKRFPMFVSDKAILIGAETRTSSPVRVLRNENGEVDGIKGLYAIGEGSGYSGGITSSAVDAMKTVCNICDVKINEW